MVICKFFQQGNCRYGQSCRFEHIYGSKYSYHASTQKQGSVHQPPTVTDEQLAAQVHADVQAALNGGQWILSCYAPFKEKPCIPGIIDTSFEESRLFIYDAKLKNCAGNAIGYMNKEIQETRLKYEQLLHPTPAIMALLRGLYHGGPVQSPFTNQAQASNDKASSLFRGAVQQTGFGQAAVINNSAFGQKSSVFNNQQHTSFFGSQADSAKSIFASANKSVFATPQPGNPFQSASQDNAKSIFAQATQNVFGPTQQSPGPANVFGGSQQNIFGQSDVFKQSPDVSSPSQPSFGSVFQISTKPTTNVFGTVQVDAVVDENSIYSKPEDLAACDIEAYQSPAFKLGFVPELPPPASLCR